MTETENTVEMKPVKPEYFRIGIAVVIACTYVSSVFDNNLRGLWLSTLALTLFTMYHLIEYFFEKKEEEKIQHG